MSPKKHNSIFPMPGTRTVPRHESRRLPEIRREDYEVVDLVFRSVNRIVTNTREKISHVLSPLTGIVGVIEGTDIGAYRSAHPEKFAHLNAPQPQEFSQPEPGDQ
jgi:hypothetical protein